MFCQTCSLPLFLVARTLDRCRLLLSSGAAVDATTSSGGATPLHRACFAGHVQLATFLLTMGYFASKQDHVGDTALHKAAKQGHKDVVSHVVSIGSI